MEVSRSVEPYRRKSRMNNFELTDLLFSNRTGACFLFEYGLETLHLAARITSMEAQLVF